ncbi:MAG: carboxypeptidase-like regulatory domain-containing protein [Planctomycetota bacterium]|nr:carboxypeptidase-like regulatory domain-containing protein [Planctomycetota bacterium]
MPGRVIVAALVAVALSLLVWLLLDGPDPTATHDGPHVEDPSPDSRPAAGLRGRAAGNLRTEAVARAGHRLEGSVLGAAGPVAAEVELRRAAGAPAWLPESGRFSVGRAARRLQPLLPDAVPLATVTAGPEGAFALPLPSAGTYELRATSTSGAVGRRLFTVVERRAVERVDVYIADGPPALHGTIRHADGRPWQGLVFGMRWGSAPRGLSWAAFVTESDAAGRYALYGVHAGQVYLQLVQLGTLAYDTDVTTVPRDGPFDVVVGGAHDVVGRVIDDESEEPLAGVVVEANRDRNRRRTSARTDEDGRFRLPLPSRPGIVRAFQDGFAPALFVGHPVPQPLTLRLRPAAGIRGRLVDVDGAGVPAGVPVQGTMEVARVANESVAALAGRDGRFELTGLHAGEAKIVAWGRGWVPAHFDPEEGPGRVVVCEPGRVLEVDVPVRRAGRVRGVVLDADGQPVARALVRVGWDTSITMHGIYLRPALTDMEGRFTLEDVAPCSDLRLEVRSEEYFESPFGPFQVRSNETTEVELKLPAAQWCDVTVLDAEGGAPVADAWVHAQVQGENERHSYGQPWRADANGRVRVGPLHAGACFLRAGSREHVAFPVGNPRTAWHPVPPGTLSATLRIARADPITGRVLLDGRPISASVRAQSTTDEGDATWFAAGRTTTEGTFRLMAPPNASVRVTADLRKHQGVWSMTKVVPAGARDVELELVFSRRGHRPPPPGDGQVWRIRVLGPDGRPVREAHGSALQEYGRNLARRRLTAVDGTFTVQLRDDAKRMFFVVTDARTAGGARAASGHFGPWDPAGGEATITLQAERTLGGHVVDDGGRGLGGVLVHARARNPDGFTRRFEGAIVGRARTDAAGAFRFAGIGEGAYRIEVQAPQGFLPGTTLDAESGMEDLRVVLRRGVDAVISVQGPDGRPARGAYARVWREDEEDREGAHADAEGRITLRNLDPSLTYELAVSLDVGEDSYYREIEPWKPGPTNVRFVRTYKIQGVVQDPQGRPLPRVGLLARDASGGVRRGRSGPTGRFAFYELAPGPVHIRTSHKGLSEEGWAQLQPTVVRAGVTDAVIVHDPGWYLDVRVTPAMPGAPAVLSEVREQRHRWIGAKAIVQGRAVFLGANEGVPVRVYAGPTDDGRYALFDGVPDATGLIELTWRPGALIRGVVTAANGKPARGARVVLRDRGVAIETQTDARGRYTLRGVPPGTWTVQVIHAGGGRAVRREQRVEAGTTADFSFRKR